VTHWAKSILVSLILLGSARPLLAAGPAINCVFYIAMENHNFQQQNKAQRVRQILDNEAAPFQNSLVTPGNSNAALVSYASDYTSVCNNAHPSEANYI
jgi:phosphatidylinositol-3-phosphatase